MDKIVDGEKVTKVIVGFLALPGSLLIEAEIDHYLRTGSWSPTPSVNRANKMNQEHIKCIRDPKLELFCYCSTVSNEINLC
jgi:hypothetical protein